MHRCTPQAEPAEGFDGWQRHSRAHLQTMDLFAYVFVIAAGMLNAVQSGSNAQLVRSLGKPWLVALLVSLITAAVFVVAMLVAGARLPEAGRIGSAPWWAWTGGLCGAAYVVGTLFFAEEMGAGLFTGLTITAGIVASIVVDHYGLVGFKQHSASVIRISGAALMIVGLALVARF